jgi:hypothetical protein
VHGGEEKKSQPLPGLEPPIIKSVTQHYTTAIDPFNIHHIQNEAQEKF